MYAEVQEVIKLSPTLVRVVLSGGTLDEFEGSLATDAYINARFIPENSPVTVPFEPEDLEGVDPALRPKPRRYTIRQWDAEQQRLSIDFVVHGEHGYAGSWAGRAKPGDRLQFNGPGGSYRPSPDVDWHLMIGDESAFGAIGASLDVLNSDDKAIVFAVVDGPDNEIEFGSEADVTINWIHRMTASNPESALPEAVARALFLDGTFDVFLHGEADEVGAVRKHLVADRGVNVGAASISPYWRRKHTDEDWRRVKRDWMRAQNASV